MRRHFVAAFLLLAPGCGAAVAPTTAPLPAPAPTPVSTPAPVATQAPQAAPAPTAKPAASATARAHPPPARPAPPPLEEPLPPLTRPFVTVKLPGIKDPLISVSGRGPRDLVFLAGESHPMDHNRYQIYRGTVIRSDGARVIDTQVPCPGYDYHSLVAGGDEVHVLGSNMYYRNVPGHFLATLSGKKSWDCNGGYSTGFAVSSGERAWMLTCDYQGLSCTLNAAGMPRVKLPSFDPSLAGDDSLSAGIESYWMSGADDGWMTHADADGGTLLLRYNGVSWSTKAVLGGLDVLSMWVDDGHQVWLTARRSHGDNAPGDAILRFDGTTLIELSVPTSFRATTVRGTGPKDVWFVGFGDAVYQWDGQRLHAGKAPFAVGDAWAAAGGELWIVGLDEERSPGPGVAAHTAAAAAETR